MVVICFLFYSFFSKFSNENQPLLLKSEKRLKRTESATLSYIYHIYIIHTHIYIISFKKVHWFSDSTSQNLPRKQHRYKDKQECSLQHHKDKKN